MREAFGLACPNCGYDTRLYIVATTTFEVWSDGAEPMSDVEWDDDSPVSCPGCGHKGTVNKFKAHSSQQEEES